MRHSHFSKTRPLHHFLFMLVAGTLFSCENNRSAPVEELPFDGEGLRTELEAVFTKNELMGLSVALITDGAVTWQGSYGLADAGRQIPVTNHTIFRIASISKTVTAMALLQLWETGKVDLDADVSTYLGWKLQHPGYPKDSITLRHLLSHRSGIRDGEGYSAFSREMVSEQLDIRELLTTEGEYFTADLFADHPPGSYFSYTNCTWGLIASVIEVVSGQRFDDYCRAHIFAPMGLTADFNVAELASLDSLAVLYQYEDEQWVPQADDYQGIAPQSRGYSGYELGQNGLLFGPQGSLRISTEDLTQLALMFINDGLHTKQRILQEETVNLMLSSEWLYDGQNGDTWENFFLSYGLGTHQTTNQPGGDIIFPDRTMVGHPGIAYGLLSDMYFEREKNSGIIFITNGSKQKYEYGENTSFYQGEEDVFRVVYPYLNELERRSRPTPE